MLLQINFEDCDLLMDEVTDKFNKDFMAPLIIAIEDVTLKTVNGEDFTIELEKVRSSVLGNYLNFPKLNHQPAMLIDICGSLNTLSLFQIFGC